MPDSMTPPLENWQGGTPPPPIGIPPLALEPGQAIRFQTWSEKPTTVHTENTTGYTGELSIRFGNQSEETIACQPGRTKIERNFEGVPVQIINVGNVPISVSTL